MDLEKETYSKVCISCFDVPIILFDKFMAKQYFQKFGRVLRIKLRPKQNVCIVEFANEKDARIAYEQSGNYEAQPFKVSWAPVKRLTNRFFGLDQYPKKRSEKKKELKMKKKDPDWPVDPEVQAELEAMNNYTTTKTYNLRPEVLSDSSAPKAQKPKSAKKSDKMRWKSDKAKQKQNEVNATPLTQNAEQEQELLNIIKKPALTCEEKFKILDARDKLIRMKLVKQSKLENIERTIGTCPDMCPEKERLMREAQHQVAIYEQASNSKSSMNHAVAVKQYSRSSADQETPLAHELRPVSVLKLTMGYLLHRIMDLCDTPDVNMAEWYHFLWDRTRGIRKDIIQQELCCEGSVTLVEQCARFHIHCSARLVAEDVSVFDQKINTENLTKCLQTLKYMYADLALKSISCPNESEFRGYIVLLNLHDGNFMWEVQELREDIQHSPEVKFAISVYLAIDKNNYVKFFQLVKSTTYLNACILLRYFNQVRYRALLTILKSFSPRQPYTQYPLDELKRILAFEDLENTIAFLEYYGLYLNAPRTHIVLNRKMVRQPDVPFVMERAVNVIESKRVGSVGEVVCGSELPEKHYESHVLFDSFDGNGFLKPSEIPNGCETDFSRNCNDSSLVAVVVGSENDGKEPEKAETNNFKNLFTFSEPSVAEVAPTLFELPNISTSFTFQTPSCVTRSPETSEVCEVDGKTSPDNKPEFVTTTEHNQPFAFINKTVHVPNWGTQFSTIYESSKNIFNNEQKAPSAVPQFSSANTTTANNITFPVSPISNKTSVVTPVEEKTNVDNEPEETQSYEDKLREELLKQKEINEAAKRQEEREYAERVRLMERQNRELEKQRQIEERERELQKQREIEETNLKSDVLYVLNDLLMKSEAIVIRDKLEEIRNRCESRRLLYYYTIWKSETQHTRRKRKNFFDNSVWIPSKSIALEAKELYTANQNLTLQDIKRYKLGKPQTIQIRAQPSITKIDIFETAWKILYEKLSRNEKFLRLNIFWKLLISTPNENENICGYHRLENIISASFDFNDTNEIVKRISANNGGSFSYSIKKIVHNFDFNDTVNGLVFIINNKITNDTCKRLQNLFVQKQNFPVAIIAKNCNYEQSKAIIDKLKLNELNRLGCLSKFDLFYDDTKDGYNLKTVLINSLKWLAENFNNFTHLEMDVLKMCLSKTICDSFYNRLNTTACLNYGLKQLLYNPEIVIGLHNQAIRYLLTIVFNYGVMNYSSFPNEFKQFLKRDEIIFPCSYEYFPEYWKSKSHLRECKAIVESFMLPIYEGKWPPSNQYSLQNNLEKFCSKIFSNPQKVVLKILSVILNQINSLHEFEKEMKLVTWLDIIKIIIAEKINEISFYGKHNLLPYVVVYKINELKQFSEFPWWFKSNIIETKIQSVNYEADIVDIVDEDQDQDLYETDDEFIDLDKIQAQLDKKAEGECVISKRNDEMELISSKLEDIEESLEISKIILTKFDKKFKELQTDF